MSQEVPHFTSRSLATTKGLLRLTELFEGLLYDETPMLRFIADPATHPEHPPVRRPDIPAISSALRSLGFYSKYVTRAFDATVTTRFTPIKADDGWHVDVSPTERNLSYFPNAPSMSLRRHTGASAAATVLARKAVFAPYGRTGFKPDRSATIYETVQEPGDSVYFISSGGVVGSLPIAQTEHRFTTIDQEKTRRIHLAEFEFRPRPN